MTVIWITITIGISFSISIYDDPKNNNFKIELGTEEINLN